MASLYSRRAVRELRHVGQEDQQPAHNAAMRARRAASVSCGVHVRWCERGGEARLRARARAEAKATRSAVHEHVRNAGKLAVEHQRILSHVF